MAPNDPPPPADGPQWNIGDVRAERDAYIGSTVNIQQAPAPPPPPAHVFTVPFPRNPAFQGREDELVALHTALQAGGPVGIQPTGLIGMGGIGKTQLAVEYAYRYGAAYPGGVAWLNAAAPLLGEFAALGAILEPVVTGRPPDEQARAAAAALRTRPRTLLVLDNLADPALLQQPVVAGLLPAALAQAGVLLLFTTRYQGAGAFFRPLRLDVLSRTAALALLLHAPAREPMRDPAHPEHGAAQGLCRMLGYLPLALEMAGAFLAEWPEVTLAGLQSRLEDEGALSALDAESADLGGRLSGVHAAALQATFQTQWATLAGEETRRLLQVTAQLPEATVIPEGRLGLLAGLAARADLGGVAPLARALRRAENAALLARLAAGQVRLHPLVREFVREQTPTAERPAFRQACAERLAAALEDYPTLEEQLALRGVDALQADLTAALGLAAEANGPTERLGRLLRLLQSEAHALRDWNREAEPRVGAQQVLAHAAELGLGTLEAGARAYLTPPYLVRRWRAGPNSLALERILTGHPDKVQAVAVTADGQRAVSGGDDGTLRVWDLTTGRAAQTMAAHVGVVRAVAVTADGSRAVSGGDSGTLQVWDLASGTAVQTLAGHEGRITTLAVTADGQRVVSGARDGTVRVWDVGSGQVVQTLAASAGGIYTLAVTANAQRVVSGARDGTVRVWDLGTGKAVQRLVGHEGAVYAVAVTADGQRAVSGGRDGTVRVWDVASGRAGQTLAGHEGAVYAVAVTADGQHAVSGGWDGQLRVWDLASGGAGQTLAGHEGAVYAVAVTANGQRAVSGGWGGPLRVWDLVRAQAEEPIVGHDAWVQAVAVTADGQRAVSGGQAGMVRVWDLSTGQVEQSLAGHDAWVEAIALTADGQRAVSGGRDGTLRVWDLTTGQTEHCFTGHEGAVHAVALQEDGRRAVSGGDDGVLHVWDLVSGRAVQTLTGHEGRITTLAVTADGQRVVSGGRDGTVRVWDLASNQAGQTLTGHEGAVQVVAVTADGRWVVSGGRDGTVRVWDLTGNRAARTLAGNQGWVNAVAVTADAQRAVSGGRDGRLRVWDLATEILLASLTLEHALYGLAIPPDACLVVTGDAGGNVWCFDYVS